MTKQVNTHVRFNENCEYQSSSTDIIINVEPQPVDVDITITNLNISHTKEGDKNNYYDDIIKVEAHVKQTINGKERDIQTGRILFYYKTETSNQRILLNDDIDSCVLTTQGRASLQFRPNRSGTIIAQYVDDKGWYETTEKSEVITLQPIPVIIKFTKNPPYLADLEDSVELKVQVRKKYQNNDDDVINYGVVTFLHYIKHFDMEDPYKRVEHVIGNPVLVNNGEASIKYIPIQTYSDLEPTDIIEGTEYIRAVYDYNNDLYFSEENAVYGYDTIEPNRAIGHWQYFESANVYTNIAIFKPNSVTIGISNKSINADGRYYYEEDKAITVEAELFDDEGKNIVLPEDSNKHLTFHVIGSYITLSNNYTFEHDAPEAFIHNLYAEDFSFDSYNYRTDDTGKRHGYFTKTISGLKPGNYTIQASTHGQIINGKVLLYKSEKSLTPVDEEVNGEIHQRHDVPDVRSDTYLDSIDISNTLYINSTFKNIEYDIHTECKKSTIKTQELINNYIESEVTINDNYKQILNGQKCIFFLPKTGTKYIGELTIKNGKLIGYPTDDIRLDSGDYSLYMYIPGGYYTKNNLDIHIKEKQSNTILLHVRSDIVLNLDYDLVSDTALGSVHYTISSDDIYYDQTFDVDVTLKKGNTVIATHSYILSSYINRYENTIEDLQSGDYTLTASAIGSVSQSFTIKPSIITQQLQTDSKIIRATPNGVVNLVIESSSADLTNLDLNKLSVYVCKNLDNFDMSQAEKCTYYTKYIKNDTIYLVVNAGTYLPTKLLFAVYYSGDSNIGETLCDAEECNTILVEPTVTIDEITNTTMLLHLNNYAIKNVTVIGKIIFMVGNRPIYEEHTKLFISDDNTDIYIQNIPQQCTGVQITINPYDSELIDIISEPDAAQALSSTFGVVNTLCSNTTNEYGMCNLEKIIKQYNDSGNQCLFPIFKNNENKPIHIARNIR